MGFKVLHFLKITLILIVYVNLYSVKALKPCISPNVRELIINEGEKLQITCTSNGTVRVSYPKTDLVAKIFTSDFETKFILQKDGTLKSRSLRKKTIYGDSGWYGCYDVSISLPKDKNYDDPNASWLYVYVKSKDNAFVSTEVQGIFGVVEESAVIPCRTTSPDLHVTLYKEGKKIEDASFDPKIGFKLENLSISDAGAYECSVQQDNYQETVGYLLYVNQNNTLKNLYISEKGLDQVVIGSHLHVKCSLKVEMDHPPFDFAWKTPRNSNTSRILEPVVEFTLQGYKLVTSEYVEKNVTFDDEGEYTCNVKSMRESMKTSTYIKVHDSSVNFINLSYDVDSHHSVTEGQSVTFSATFSGDPLPSLFWDGPDRKSMNAWDNKSYMINYETSMSTLEIKNVSFKDAGTYSLVAFNDVQKERLNFTLEVFGKPLVHIRNHALNYTLNENKKFACEITSNPKPSISWFYTRCSTVSSENECKTVELEIYKVYVISKILVVTEVETQLDANGTISCTVCNNFGCSSDELTVFIANSD